MSGLNTIVPSVRNWQIFERERQTRWKCEVHSQILHTYVAQAKKCERERPEVVYGRVTELLAGLSGRLSSLNTAVANLSASHEQHEREHGEHKGFHADHNF